jgi:iron(III) transport system ATP-binding protein
LEQPETGTIQIAGRVVCSADSRFVPAEQRPIGMVFQSYAIWPHMTVFENVAYPLGGRRLSKTQMAEEVMRVLALVGLAELADRPSPQLSGGQQQRVALARALVANPKVMLLDEPLSNLDAKLRQQMRVEIRDLQRRTGVTAVYVTHDQEEAMAVSDEILFMSNGQIIERGCPEEIYFRPKNRLTAEFLGEANFLTGEIMGTEQDYLVVQTPGGKIACNRKENSGLGARVTVFFRPEDVEILREKPANSFLLSGVISNTVFLGKMAECSVDAASENHLKVSVHARFNPKKGESVYLAIDPAVCSIMNE